MKEITFTGTLFLLCVAAMPLMSLAAPGELWVVTTTTELEGKHSDWLSCVQNSDCEAVKATYCHSVYAFNKSFLKEWLAFDAQMPRERSGVSDACGKVGQFYPSLSEGGAACERGKCIFRYTPSKKTE